MSHFYDATFRGNISEPEIKEVGSNTLQEFTVFAQNQRKNRDTDQYEEVSESKPVRVTLWNDNINYDLGKGDLVSVTGSFSVEEFTRRDGTPGYGFQTDYVSDVEIKISKAAGSSRTSQPAAAGAGFGGGASKGSGFGY